MPDRYGFDELGDDVACIQEGCQARGPRWDWPEKKRRAHHRSHGPDALSPARPPRNYHSGNENGGPTMSAQKEKVSGRQACIAAIRAAGKPLTANEIATAVVESGIVPGLKGLTPKATLSAQITSGAKKGQVFKRVGSTKPAKFDLKADAPESPDGLVDALKAKVKEVTSRQPVKRQTAAEKPKAEKEAPAAATAQADPQTAAGASGGKRESGPDPKPGSGKTK